MGRESRVKKSRVCSKCKLDFINMSAAQIQVHAFVCDFEKATGIEIIKMGPTNEESNAETESTGA